MDACGYTYCSETLDHQSWIDHVFASELLSCDFTNFKIVDSGCNNMTIIPLHGTLNGVMMYQSVVIL